MRWHHDRLRLTPHRRELDIARGVVEGWTSNHHGDVDGFVLDSGALVRFPPHFGNDVVSIVKTGDDVTVTGAEHTPPDGNTHLVAYTIDSSGGHLMLDVGDHALGHRHITANAPVHVDRERSSLLPIRSDLRPSFDARLRAVEARMAELLRRLDSPTEEGVDSGN